MSPQAGVMVDRGVHRRRLRRATNVFAKRGGTRTPRELRPSRARARCARHAAPTSAALAAGSRAAQGAFWWGNVAELRAPTQWLL